MWLLEIPLCQINPTQLFDTRPVNIIKSAARNYPFLTKLNGDQIKQRFLRSTTPLSAKSSIPLVSKRYH
jgi:hypothetical protein